MIDDNTTIGELKAQAIHATTQRIPAFGNMQFRAINMRKPGDIVPTHAHNFDHNLIVLKGTVLIRAQRVEGLDEPDATLEGEDAPMGQGTTWRYIGEAVERVYKAPSLVLIRHNMAHKFICIDGPVQAMCAFAVRNQDGEVIQKAEEWDGSTFFSRMVEYD